MTNTFISKVLAEREILGIVNSAYGNDLQLSGLSSAAIESWRDRVGLPGSHLLIGTLRSLGGLTQTLSNRSNESFTPFHPNTAPEIRRKVSELQALVAMARR